MKLNKIKGIRMVESKATNILGLNNNGMQIIPQEIPHSHIQQIIVWIGHGLR
jgi:hypothetical protein